MTKFVSRYVFEVAAAAGLTAAALFILIVGIPEASGRQDSPIAVSGAWARPTMGQHGNGVVYLTIENNSAAGDRLTGVRTGVSEKAMFHETTNEGGVMRMRHVQGGIPIPADATVKFAPAGFHIMLVGVKAPLTKGQTFPATLVFEKAGEIETSVSVNMMAPDQAE